MLERMWSKDGRFMYFGLILTTSISKVLDFDACKGFTIFLSCLFPCGLSNGDKHPKSLAGVLVNIVKHTHTGGQIIHSAK